MTKPTTAPAKRRPRLDEWIRSSGKNQAWIADNVGVRQSTVSAWVRGAGIRFEHGVRLREVTGLSDDDINCVVEVDEPASSPSLPDSGESTDAA